MATMRGAKSHPTSTITEGRTRRASPAIALTPLNTVCVSELPSAWPSTSSHYWGIERTTKDGVSRKDRALLSIEIVKFDKRIR